MEPTTLHRDNYNVSKITKYQSIVKNKTGRNSLLLHQRTDAKQKDKIDLYDIINNIYKNIWHLNSKVPFK